MKRSEEIQKEIDETRARIDHDVQTIQTKLKQSTDPSYLAQEEPTKLALIGGGILLLLAFIFRSKRRKKQKAVKATEQNNLKEMEATSVWMDADMRNALVNVLTAEGLRWLQAQEQPHEAKSLRSEAEEKVEETESALRSKIAPAVDEVTSSLEQVRKKMASAAKNASKTMAEATDELANTGKEVVAGAGQAASDLSDQAADAQADVEQKAHKLGVRMGLVEPTFSEKVAASLEDLADAVRPTPPTVGEQLAAKAEKLRADTESAAAQVGDQLSDVAESAKTAVGQMTPRKKSLLERLFGR